MVAFRETTDLERAQAWLRAHLGAIKDGGLWEIPRAATIYQIDHGAKTLERVVGDGDPATEQVARTIGWSIGK
jgi:hypothetical protein